jgi:hypothetical protein
VIEEEISFSFFLKTGSCIKKDIPPYSSESLARKRRTTGAGIVPVKCPGCSDRRESLIPSLFVYCITRGRIPSERKAEQEPEK